MPRPHHFTALLLLFFSFNAMGQMSKQQIDSVMKLLATAKEDTVKVNLYKTLANEVGYSDTKKALEYAQQGYDLSYKLDYKKGIATMNYVIATIYSDQGETVKADSFLTVASEKYEELNDAGGTARVFNAKGALNYMTGNYLLSADFFAKSAEAFEKINDAKNSLAANQNLIAVLGNINNHEKAAELGKKILKILEKDGSELEIGYALQTLTTDLIYLDRLDEAAQYMERMHAIANTNADQALSAEIYSTMGTYYYRKNDFTKAAEYFSTSLQKAESLNNIFQLANHYNSLGQAYYRSGHFTQAREVLLKGMKLANESGNRRAQSNIANSLSSLYDSTGNYKLAYENLLLSAEIRDSLLNSETRNTTTQLETQYETKKKENEILRLNDEQQKKDFQINRRNAYIGVGIGLIAALILILYLLRKNYKGHIGTIRKEQQVMSLQSMINGQETERIRIAKDLHDGLGGVFSTVKMHYSTLQDEVPGVKDNMMYRKTFELIDSASDELRKIAHNMMPEVLMKVGLVEALKDFCNNISSGRLLKISLQNYGMEKRLSTSTEIMLFRIIQELINNIIKHAQASEAIVQFNRLGNRLSITIEDNGKGFNTKEAEEKETMGMTTVKSRVDYLNGKLTIDSRKDIGTTVMIDLLLNEN